MRLLTWGVMVPADKILKAARLHNVDMIGLSGLITPSLDEMVHMAKEMEREGFNIPLLIGGATTSKTHTAVKIEQQYKRGTVVHVLDASRAVTVASSLLGEDKAKFIADNRAELERVRVQRGNRQSAKRYLSLRQARENKQKLDFDTYTPPVPKQLGITVLENYSLSELIEFIDWTPFFQSWQLAGPYPAILTDSVVGETATKLFADAQAMLKLIVEEKMVTSQRYFWFIPC